MSTITTTQNIPSSVTTKNYSQSKQNIAAVSLRAQIVNRTANQAIATGATCGAVAIAFGIGFKLAISAAITAPLLPLSITLGILALILIVGGLIAKYVVNYVNGVSQAQKQTTLPSFTGASKSTGPVPSAPSLDDPPAYTPRTKKAVQVNYSYQMYADDWEGQPLLPPPPGATIVEAFGVVNNDGTFNSNYPITVPPGATDMNLAIGGWNNSQSTLPPWGPNGFYVLVNSIDPSDPNPGPLETTFMQSIGNVLSANPTVWKKITLDFENYDHTLDPEKYTKLVLELSAYLKTNFPDVKLQMAISPNKKNRDYFNLQALAAAGVTFQLMCYDYAMGQSTNNILVLPNAPVDGPEGQETIEGDIDEFVNGEKIPQKQISIGIPGYGIAYNCAPSLTPDVIQTGLDTWSLPATGGYGTSNGQITDDVILNNIGDWDKPLAPWAQYIDKFGNYYYYNSQSGAMYAANPPACFDRGIVPLIKSKYPGVSGFFQWEAVGNTQGVVMLERVMQDMGSPSSVRNLQPVEKPKPPRIQGRRPGERTPVLKPVETPNPARKRHLAPPFNFVRGRPVQNRAPIEI